ncbi:MAG TPA: hypothetical protein VKR58_11885 [Aquella sp.]|nr:hypothetical protein [Aquella sp.]
MNKDDILKVVKLSLSIKNDIQKISSLISEEFDENGILLKQLASMSSHETIFLRELNRLVHGNSQSENGIIKEFLKYCGCKN